MMQDGIGIEAKGFFRVQIIETATGNILEDYEDNNLVVTLGKANTAQLLAGAATGKKINKIAVGIGTTPPDVADTALTTPFIKNIDGYSFPNTNEVLFSWTIETTEANGLSITEFGLMNDSGVLFARKIRSAIIKSSSIKLVGTWKITIN
ncbi:MAG: hypothetical protein JNL72_09050 [Flavipsychrobacter sp.]|nr:hypothetical protein [Flavipsychrobacter sp.]